MLLALFGITNDGLNLFVNLVVLFLVVVWIALIAWTYLDARRRILLGLVVRAVAQGPAGGVLWPVRVADSRIFGRLTCLRSSRAVDARSR